MSTDLETKQAEKNEIQDRSTAEHSRCCSGSESGTENAGSNDTEGLPLQRRNKFREIFPEKIPQEKPGPSKHRLQNPKAKAI